MKNNIKTISVPALRRLPLYIQAAKHLYEEGIRNISCNDLAKMLNIDPTLIRKDIASTGAEGKPKAGYNIEELLTDIESFLGWDNLSEAFLVGAGNLGRALVGYEGFELHGLKIVAVFDNDKTKIGTLISGKEILPVAKLKSLAQRMKIKTGILTVPAAAAQGVADNMIDGGIEAIWNFAQVRLSVPEGIIVENVDLASSLATLCGKLRAIHFSKKTSQKTKIKKIQ